MMEVEPASETLCSLNQNEMIEMSNICQFNNTPLSQPLARIHTDGRVSQVC